MIWVKAKLSLRKERSRSNDPPLRPSHRSRLFLSFLFLILCGEAAASPSNFYTMADRWQKNQEKDASPKVSKNDAIEESFASSLRESGQGAAVSAPIAPILRKNLSELAQAGRVVEIEQNQVLFARSDKKIIKFIATDEGIVWLESAEADVLAIKGVGVGRTFVHVWDEERRSTFEIRVLVPRFVPSPEQVRQLEILERSRPFTLEYSNSRNAFYEGDKYADLGRTSLDFDQQLRLLGDTPHGVVSGYLNNRKDLDKFIFSDMQLALSDGKVGPYRNFNLKVIDSSIEPGLMVFSQARVRGANLEHWDDPKRLTWHTFYGREQPGILGSINPGFISKRSPDSFLSGQWLHYKFNENAKVQAGYFNGYGRARPDELNKHGFGLKGDFGAGSHVRFVPEVDSDSERFAQRHATYLNFKKLMVKSEFRSLDKKFQSMIGTPAGQGEVGHRLEVRSPITDAINFEGSTDIFRDRVIPNPEEIDRYNIHTDLMLTIIPRERSSLILTYQDFDDTGRLGPTKSRSIGVQYNQQVRLWNHPVSLFTRYQNRDNTNLTNPLSNYDQNQFVAGLNTELFWGIYFSAQHEWNELYEREIDATTYPSATTYSWNWARRIPSTPIDLDLSFRIRDEEETESLNSFMLGEDSTEVSATLFYRKYEHWDIYVTGRFENFVPESLDITEPRVEAQVITGMRYLYDTKIRWEPVGSVKGHVFKDLNGDGEQQTNEPGLKGLGVKISQDRDTLTDESGFYEFKSISGRKAVVRFDSMKLPYGFVLTGPSERELKIENGVTAVVNFGLVPRSQIAGVVFSDLNRNGKYDPSDKLIPKAKLILEDGRMVRSNHMGAYVFSDVIAGDHTVTLDLVSLPKGYLPSDRPVKKIALFEGIRYELPFALRAERVATGRVFEDANKNRFLDPGEGGIAGVTVKLGDRTSVTDKDGWYLFDDCPSGRYEITIDAASLPEGFTAPEPRTLQFAAEPSTLSDVNLGAKKTQAPPPAAPASETL